MTAVAGGPYNDKDGRPLPLIPLLVSLIIFSSANETGAVSLLTKTDT